MRYATLVRSAATLLFATLAWASLAAAEKWPDRPVRIIVPFPAGQGADIIARVMADKLSAQLGQPFLVENRPGAGSLLGTAYAAKAPADGYTLLMGGSSAMVINPFLYSNPGYDTLRDFAPITNAASLPMVIIVGPASRMHTIQELIAYAKAKPGKVTYGSSGNGSTHHLIQAMFAKAAGIELTHVPYKGTVASMTDLIGGQIDMMADTQPSLVPFIKSGKVRALAITTAERSPFLPDVPSLAEQALPGFDMKAWSGLFAPRATPEPILDRLASESVAILKTPEMQRRFAELSMTVIADTRTEFEAYVTAELQRWSAAVKASGAKLD